MRTDENHTVAYFYCRRDTNQPKKEDPEEIIRAILRQLVILLPSRLSDPVKAEYEKAKKEVRDHGPIRFLTFEECANFIVDLASDHPVSIVIDALDECREIPQGSQKDRQDLLNLLETITKTGHVKAFLSSRDDGDIKSRLQNHPNIPIGASKNGPDILRFIETKVDILFSKKRHHWGSDENLKQKVINTLNSQADGMSVYINCHLAIFV
jgi:hypothetical protein